MIVRSPQPLLAAFVEHYWLARDNRDTAYRILPDGCVDFVVEIGGGGATEWLYGTSTRCLTTPVERDDLRVEVDRRASHGNEIEAHLAICSPRPTTSACARHKGATSMGKGRVGREQGSSRVAALLHRDYCHLGRAAQFG
jgi:hypothetical protein